MDETSIIRVNALWYFSCNDETRSKINKRKDPCNAETKLHPCKTYNSIAVRYYSEQVASSSGLVFAISAKINLPLTIYFFDKKSSMRKPSSYKLLQSINKRYIVRDCII